MKTVSLSGSPRENVGKKDAKKNRNLGLIPCVIYGGKEQIHFTVEEKSFSKLIFTPEVYLINITIDGKEYNAIMQDIQYHPVSDRVLHIDFLELIPGKPVTIAVPIKVTGVSKGVLAGGKLIRKKRKVRVKALQEHLPDNIVLDITDLEIGDAIKIRDIKLDNLELLDNPRDMVVAVQVTRIAAGMEAGEEEVEEEEGEGAVEEGAQEESPAE